MGDNFTFQIPSSPNCTEKRAGPNRKFLGSIAIIVNLAKAWKTVCNLNRLLWWVFLCWKSLEVMTVIQVISCLEKQSTHQKSKTKLREHRTQYWNYVISLASKRTQSAYWAKNNQWQREIHWEITKELPWDSMISTCLYWKAAIAAACCKSTAPIDNDGAIMQPYPPKSKLCQWVDGERKWN
jgi:hypothetical protein